MSSHVFSQKITYNGNIVPGYYVSTVVTETAEIQRRAKRHTPAKPWWNDNLSDLWARLSWAESK